jgi:hypothetical protein
MREADEVTESEEEEIIQRWLLENAVYFCRICRCLLKL